MLGKMILEGSNIYKREKVGNNDPSGVEHL